MVIRSFEKVFDSSTPALEVNLTHLFNNGRAIRTDCDWTSDVFADLSSALDVGSLGKLANPIEAHLDCHLSIGFAAGKLLAPKKGFQIDLRRGRRPKLFVVEFFLKLDITMNFNVFFQRRINMKSLFVFAAAFLVSVSGIAMPKVGDQAVYSSDYTEPGSVVVTSAIDLSITAFHASSGYYNFREITTTNKQSQVEDGFSNYVEDAASMNHMLNHCDVTSKWKSVTVPAGTFNACELTLTEPDANMKRTIWLVRDIPFNVIKREDILRPTGERTLVQLQSFRLGK